jgi:hypothetical protein
MSVANPKQMRGNAGSRSAPYPDGTIARPHGNAPVPTVTCLTAACPTRLHPA